MGHLSKGPRWPQHPFALLQVALVAVRQPLVEHLRTGIACPFRLLFCPISPVVHFLLSNFCIIQFAITATLLTDDPPGIGCTMGVNDWAAAAADDDDGCAETTMLGFAFGMTGGADCTETVGGGTTVWVASVVTVPIGWEVSKSVGGGGPDDATGIRRTTHGR